MDKPLKIFGEHQENAVEQIQHVMRDDRVVAGALMADHHLGYSMPIGGVVAYKDAISPSGVGFDIACGNMCVRTNVRLTDLVPHGVPDDAYEPEQMTAHIKPIMREIQRRVSFGLGRSNAEPVEHELFDDELWETQELKPLKEKAMAQLGTVGSGNHYVDLLIDDEGRVWIANHFGSRGFGHTVASGFLAVAAGKTFTDRVRESEDPAVLDIGTPSGDMYVEAMRLAGRYAYAGREYVIGQVLNLLGAESDFEVHNHHNFAWEENGNWVVRKGATPLTYEFAFIGGSMGDVSVIVRGRKDSADPTDIRDIGAIGSAPHGAGRIMSRTKAAGRLRKMWMCPNRNCDFEPYRSTGNTMSGHEKGKCPKCGIPLRKISMLDTSEAAINWNEVRDDLTARGISVLGAGADEAPGVYKDLTTVLSAHPNIEILHSLTPIGVVMAGSDVRDPYKN